MYYLYVLFTILFYILPFLVSPSCWWLIILFPIFFLRLVTKYQFTWWQLGLGTFVVILFQLFGLVHSLYGMATGPGYVRILPGLCFVLYLTLYFVIAYIMMQWFCQWRLVHNFFEYRLSLWTFVLWATICLIDQYAFVPLGSWQGYPFLNPLLPLAECPQLLWPVKYLGVLGALLCFLAISAGVVMTCVMKRVWCVLGVGFLYGVWFFGAWGVPCGDPPLWLDRVVVFPCSYPAEIDGCAAVRSLSDDLSEIVRQYPSCTFIIMPESALPVYVTSILEVEGVTLPVSLLAGGYRRVGDTCHNCLFFFSDNVLRSCFGKRCLVPGTEYVPSNCGYMMPRALFFSCAPPLEPSHNERPCIRWDERSFVPYICSELFLSAVPDDVYDMIPIVVCVNDSWCSRDYVRRCMQLCARLRAISWDRDILYASFHHAGYITKTGREIMVTRV